MTTNIIAVWLIVIALCQANTLTTALANRANALKDGPSSQYLNDEGIGTRQNKNVDNVQETKRHLSFLSSNCWTWAKKVAFLHDKENL